MGPGVDKLSSSRQSLIVSILSAGTFFGSAFFLQSAPNLNAYKMEYRRSDRW